MVLDFDQILERYIGKFGRYQKKRLIFLAVLCGFLSTHSSMSSVFIAAKPEFHCMPPENLYNVNCTKDDILQYSIPKNRDGSFSQCKMYSLNSSQATESDICPSITNSNGSVKHHPVTKLCGRWEYSKELYELTVVTEWDLVCDNNYMAANTAGFYMAARCIGTLLGGYVADRYVFFLY